MKKIIKLKKRYKDKRNFIIKIIPFILVIIVLMLSVGWSTFSQKLEIDGMEATVRVQADIRITGISVSIDDFDNNNAISNWEDYNVKSIHTSVNLPNDKSQIKYKVQITNLGNAEMGILNITGLPDYLEYKIEGYNLKDKICVENNCKLGIQKDIYIIIKYKNGVKTTDNTNHTISLDFDFRPYHKITYSNFLIDTNKFPKEILDGDNLEIQFPTDIEKKDIFVSVNSASTDFQYDNNLLKLNNVSGDVVIQYRTLKDRIIQLAQGKKCNYNGNVYDLSTTDIACNGADGHDDIPNYYTYLSGTNECLDFNYVWYSGYMWRITEILDDGSVKMIAENILSAINFGSNPYFANSYIKQWLNEDFLDTLYNYRKILVTDATWDISPWYNWCWVAPPIQTQATVGLLNPYEFNKTALYSNDNFLNLGHSWWLSSYSSIDNPYIAVSGVQHDGSITGWNVPNTAFGVRPMVVLKADVKFSGEGTKDNPFVLLDDIPNAKSEDKINTRTPGELVQINDMLYRIVNIHKNEEGKLVTKLKSANYVTDENGEVMEKQFGSMDPNMYGYEKIVESQNEEYWGAYLNGSWLQEQDILKYLVKDTYYLDPAQDKKEYGSTIGSYKNTTCKEKNTDETIKKCEKTTNTWTGYVGLPIVGELFAYPLGGTDVHDYMTATMTPYGDSSFPMTGAFDSETQGIFQQKYDLKFAVKPTITLNENVIIKSGDGKTPQTAFEIKLP